MIHLSEEDLQFTPLRNMRSRRLLRRTQSNKGELVERMARAIPGDGSDAAGKGMRRITSASVKDHGPV